MENKLDFKKLLEEYKKVKSETSLEEIEAENKTLEADVKLLEKDIKGLDARITQIEQEKQALDAIVSNAEYAENIEILKDTIEKGKAEKENSIKEVNVLKTKKEEELRKKQEKRLENDKKVEENKNIGTNLIAKAKTETENANKSIDKEIEKLEKRKEKYGIVLEKDADGKTIKKQLTAEEKLVVEKIENEIEGLKKQKDINVRKFEQFEKMIKRHEKMNEKETLKKEADKKEVHKEKEEKVEEEKVEEEKVEEEKVEEEKVEEEKVEEEKVAVAEGTEYNIPSWLLHGPEQVKEESKEEPSDVPELDDEAVIVEETSENKTASELDDTSDFSTINEENRRLVEELAKKEGLTPEEEYKKLLDYANKDKVSFNQMIDNRAQQAGLKPLDINGIYVDEMGYGIKYGSFDNYRYYEIGTKNSEDGVKIDLDRKSEAQYKEFILNKFPEAKECIDKLDVGIFNILYCSKNHEMCKTYIEAMLLGKETEKYFPEVQYDVEMAKGLSRNDTVVRRNARNHEKAKIATVEGKNGNIFTRVYDYFRETGANLAVKLSKAFDKDNWNKEVKQLQDGMKLMLNPPKEEKSFKDMQKEGAPSLEQQAEYAKSAGERAQNNAEPIQIKESTENEK